MMCSIVCLCIALLVYACALFLRVHMSILSFIIPQHVVACRILRRGSTPIRISAA